MGRLRGLLATAGVIVAMLSGTAAQVRQPRAVTIPTVGTIAGRVEIESNRQRTPVRRATVTLRDEAGQTRATATDSDGRYRFEGIAAGTYRLFVEKPGFVSASVGIQAAGTSTVNLEMQRGGALEGRFIDDRGDPIARVTVTADRVPDASEGPVASDARSAVTDDLGRFRVHTLPPGRYRIYATPPPPASGDKLFYPGTANPAEARVITVAAGQTVGGFDFTVPTAPLSPIAAEALASAERETDSAPPEPGFSARISGRVTHSDSGRPIANATVDLMSSPGARRSIRRVVRTDASGQFEFTRLAGGEYVATVTAIGFISADASLMRPGGGGTPIAVKDGERKDRADVVLAPASAIEIRVMDEFGDPAPGLVLQVAQRTYVGLAELPVFLPGVGFTTTGPTDDRGWFRTSGLYPGDYYLMAVSTPFEPSAPTGFATTYFPGTSSADAATSVHIVAGLDALDLGFSLVGARTATISGVATDAAGRPAPATQVALLPIHNGEVRALVMARIATAVDGRFSYRDVPEGTYVVQGMGAGGFGSSPVTVRALTDREPSPVALTLRPSTTASGHIAFEGDAARPRAPDGVILVFQPTDFTFGPVTSNRIASTINADWDFEIPNLAGHGVIRVVGPPGFALARVRIQGRDITDAPYDFQSADVNGLEIVLTSRFGSLSGTVSSGDRAVLNATVVVFGADGAALTYVSRTYHVGRTNEQGTFTLPGLVPGRYLAVAMPARSGPLDPIAILALRSVATPIVVSEGANAGLTLTIVR